MTSDRALRVSAFGFALFFTLVVVLGYIPGLNAAAHQHHAAGSDPTEHMLLGRYVISLLDDVTHGMTAILLAVASLHSARMSRLALTAFGWYYCTDAVIYLVTGVLQQSAIVANLLLNLPHVVLSSIMLGLAYRGRANVSRVDLLPVGVQTAG